MKVPVIGLVGLGGFGRIHFETLRRFQQAGRLRVPAVCDPAIAGDPSLKAGLEADGIRSYETLRAMLDAGRELDAVVLSTPISLHEEMVCECLDRDLHVYLEKPPVPLIGQLERLIARDAHSRVSVGFHMVDFRWVRQLKAALSAGQAGEIREIAVSANWPRRDSYYWRSNWAGRMSVEGKPVFDGPATNALAHLIHLAMYFAGEAPSGFAAPVAVRGEYYRVRAIESYDVAGLEGLLSTGAEFGAVLSHASRTSFPFRMEIRGSEGWCRISEGGEIVTSWCEPVRMEPLASHQLDGAYTNFLDHISGRKSSPTTSLRDARGYVLATNAALVSSGGVHSLDDHWIEAMEVDGGSLFHVTGLDEALAAGGRLLFSDLGIPWAVKTPRIDIGLCDDLDARARGFVMGVGDPVSARPASLA